MGFAILMFGMSAMSGAVAGLKDNETFVNMLTVFSNPIMGILVGTIFTAIIQSSSASVGVLQALALTCNIPFSTAIPIILGQNIGTTITPIISSLKGNTESKRVAMSCLYIKIIGVVIFTAVFYALHYFIGFEFMNSRAGAMEIAVFHTLFNIISTVILMPFCSWLEKIAIKTIPDKKKDKVLKYEFWGLLILVAIPLPGTGAWTGALVAAMLDMRLTRAFPAIATGVVIAGIIVTVATYGVASIF